MAATKKKKEEKKAPVKKEKKKEFVCKDRNCPIHGQLPTRGITLEGIVTSDKMDKTVVVQKNYYVKSKKYERYRAAKSKIPAHNPPCIDAKAGDKVRIEECRRLSKTVNFVVTKKIN